MKQLLLTIAIVFSFHYGMSMDKNNLSGTSADVIQLKRADHFGLTVPDIKLASDFFKETFGAKEVDKFGPLFVPGGWMTENLNVPSQAIIKKVVLLEIPGQFFIELFEYKVPEQALEIPNNSDVGGHHIGFAVDDIEKSTQQLRDKGVKVLGEVKNIKAGPYSIDWIYFLTPWGTSLELVQKKQIK